LQDKLEPLLQLGDWKKDKVFTNSREFICLNDTHAEAKVVQSVSKYNATVLNFVRRREQRSKEKIAILSGAASRMMVRVLGKRQKNNDDLHYSNSLTYLEQKETDYSRTLRSLKRHCFGECVTASHAEIPIAKLQWKIS
jgi:hypothetical protein